MTYDCICTDPPWPVVTNRGTSTGRPGVAYPTMDVSQIIDKLEMAAQQIPRYGFMVVIAPDSFRTPLDRDLGGLERRRPGVWWKVTGGMGYGLKRDFEDIHYWTGPDWSPRTNICGVLPVPRGHDRYCTGKPALLWHYLLEAFAQPGWVVYDPFAGGGAVREAAALLGLTSIVEDLPVVQAKLDMTEPMGLINVRG